ncbi:MAG: hypothetical protein M1838_001936 [Thelocarpon superellum]|nr:MAG: hypothetical protein M1838_001936 [Thelocarpon superellum]
MIGRSLVLVTALAVAGHAAQPSAPAPVAAPLRELPWGQLSFLHTTDTHGWHGGHLQEPSYSADWGDYVSFAAHMKSLAEVQGNDLLLVDTGDRVEGNGLYDASSPKGRFTSDVFKQQEIDIICSGNHELYKKHTSDREYLVTVPNFKDNYIASNIDILDPHTGDRVPLAPRFRKFTTEKQKIRVLAFGFLFDFTGNYNNTIVQPVEKTIEETWFQDAIRDEEIDLVVVVGHVALRSKEYNAIFKTIRDVRWDMPIQFFGGHTHIRDFTKYDSKSSALESGRYMETIGWLSIDGLSTADKKAHATAGLSFQRRYIDNNLYSLHHHTNLNASTFPTAHGTKVSKVIAEARTALGLDKMFGCAPRDLWLNRVKYPGKHSIFSWLQESVIPDTVTDPKRKDQAKMVITNTGAIRFDIFKGAFTRDHTFIVSPFESEFRFIKDVPYNTAKRLLPLLNSQGPVLSGGPAKLQASELAPPEQMSITHDIVYDEGQMDESAFFRDHSQQHLGPSPLGSASKLIPGYTTQDDGGNDGDDTIHSTINFYRVPNCIQSEVGFPNTTADGAETPEKVDLIFIDFIEPWILLALQFLGSDFEASDVDSYAPGKSFTVMISDWIQANWGRDC